MQTYTNEELRKFEAELKPYRVTKTLSTKETISYIDFDTYLCDQGACVKQEGSYAPAIANIPLFKQLTEKFEQLGKLQHKRIYAKAQELKERDAMHTQPTLG